MTDDGKGCAYGAVVAIVTMLVVLMFVGWPLWSFLTR